MARWAVGLQGFDLQYEPRRAIKAQVLADFIAEFSYDGRQLAYLPPAPTDEPWELFVDGASNIKGCGIGLVLMTPDRTCLETSIRLSFKATNNEAEYEGLLAGLKWARLLGVKILKVFSDSLLIVNQVNGDYTALEPRMIAYLGLIKEELGRFSSEPDIRQIPREHNTHADALARLASVVPRDFKRMISVEVLDTPSISVDPTIHLVLNIDRGPSWMDPIRDWLGKGTVPEDKEEALRVKKLAMRFWLPDESDGKLFRKSFSGPFLRCIHPEEVEGLLEELHEGSCGAHSGGRSMAHRAITQGFWWPNMHADSKAYVLKCDKCQKFGPLIRLPANEMTSISSPWPFAKWGIDIVGPMPKTPGKEKFLIVATDYFTKWVEAAPLSRIRDLDIINFVWRYIFSRFGMPYAIITDNGTQFSSKKFKDFCSEHGVKNLYSSPYNPQSNGLAERTNRTILEGIKKRLEAAKGLWAKQLLHTLWTYRTTPRKPTGETPFALTYGAEAVIPPEMEFSTARVQFFAEHENDKILALNLDLMEEKREEALLRLASYQQKLRLYYSHRVRTREYEVGDKVLRRVLEGTRNRKEGKLGPTWEGPYRITKVCPGGAYRITSIWGKPSKYPWNGRNLKKFFE